MIPHKHLIINIEGSPFILSIMTLFLGLLSVIHFSSQVWVKLIQMCSMHCFIDGLGNNGFTNPIISCCLESSSAYNPFSSRFPFSVAIHHRSVCRVNFLHNIPPLLPPGDHARV